MTKPRNKKSAVPGDEIRSIAPDRGACLASGMITDEGRKVAFMYREASDRDIDSGWRFLSGFESDAYMDDPANHCVYDVNTIANYDPDIIPFLDAPVGSAFEREDGVGDFVEVTDFTPPAD